MFSALSAANGVWLTESGRRLACAPAPTPAPNQTLQEMHRNAARDKRGRRLGHQRHTPF
jgi:hypothetical protein